MRYVRAPMWALRRSTLLFPFVFGLSLAALGCGVVYPELSSPVRTPPPGFTLEPPPPNDILYLRFEGAEIPARTRDGRQWDSLGGAAPDPFAKLFVDGKEVIVTPVQSDTLAPKWPDQVRANYRIRRGAALRLEVWDSNPINHQPICVKELANLHDEASTEYPFEINCESGAIVRMVVEPARGRLGLGLYYELHTERAFVTRVLQESPARRAGLAQGDEILSVQGKPVATMAEGELQSLINANASLGVEMSVLRRDGVKRQVKLKNGAIYPVIGEPIGVE